MTRFRPIAGAVWDGRDLVVTDELEVRAPGPGEVMVQVLASGVCHSDVNVLDGTSPRVAPMVLGHEAAGRVAELGPDVGGLQVGDAVAIGSLTPCRTCTACREERFTDCDAAFGTDNLPFRYRGDAARAYANISSFAGYTTVKASQLQRTDGIAPEHAALIGCAVITGYGVVRNVAHVRPGQRVAVCGIGGIGVNALQTARLQGAAEIVAVDVNPAKAAVARHFGATDVVLVEPRSDREALVEQLRPYGPFDAVVECTGAVPVIEAASDLLAPGGVLALVGIPPRGTRASFDVNHLFRGRRIAGSLAGAMHPDRDLRDIVEHVQAGRLDLAAQVERVWPLAEIGDAVDALRSGRVVRAVIAHPHAG